MEKIPTMFMRDEKTRKVIDVLTPGCLWVVQGEVIATEKLDGTNIRVTIRSHEVVRVEKRRNPTKEQKARGIIEPWYVDAVRGAPEDKYIFAAVDGTGCAGFEDGEHCAEALGPNIQGNPLGFKENFFVPFNLRPPVLVGAPRTFETLKTFFGTHYAWTIMQGAVPEYMEGIVFHHPDGRRAKIKRKDFGL